MSQLTVVIPARNEAGCIRQTILGIQDQVLSARIIVVVDHSTDDTVGVAGSTGAQVIEVDTYGYGNAVRAGLCAVKTSWVTVMTADGSDSAVDLRKMMTLAHTTLTAVFGDRFSSGRPSTYPRLKWCVNRLGNHLAARLVGARNCDHWPWQWYADLTNPFKLYPTAVVDALLPNCRATDMSLGFELACLYVLGGGQFNVIPMFWRDRLIGSSKFSSHQTLGYLRTLIHVLQ